MNDTLSREVRLTAVVIAKLYEAGIDENDPDWAELLDNECDGPERARRMLWVALQAEDQAAAIKTRQELLAARRSRLEDRGQRLRQTVLWMMGEMGLTKLPAPEFTATVSTPKKGPVVVTAPVEELPDRFVRVKREINKTAIAKALDAGEPMEGIAMLGNPKPILTIRQS